MYGEGNNSTLAAPGQTELVQAPSQSGQQPSISWGHDYNYNSQTLEGKVEKTAEPYRLSSLFHYTIIVFCVCVGNLIVVGMGILYLWISDKYEFTDFLKDYGFEDFSIKLNLYITIFISIRFAIFLS